MFDTNNVPRTKLIFNVILKSKFTVYPKKILDLLTHNFHIGHAWYELLVNINIIKASDFSLKFNMRVSSLCPSSKLQVDIKIYNVQMYVTLIGK